MTQPKDGDGPRGGDENGRGRTGGDPPDLTPTAATEEWGLTSEPWIFAVDPQGVVRASFEGVASEQELKDAVELIAGS